MSRRVSVLLGVVGASLFAASGAYAQAAGGSVSIGGSGGASAPPAASGGATGNVTAGATAQPAAVGATGSGPIVQAPGTTKPNGDPRFLFDLHVGGLIEVDADEETESPGGALIGGNIFYGPLKWLDLGIGYERSFLGTDDTEFNSGNGERRTTRGAHALWLTGRFYPYENEDFAFFIDVAGAPVWQTLSASSSNTIDDGTSTEPLLVSAACDGHDSAKLGLRAGAGFEFPLTSLLIMHAQAGVDHYRFNGDVIDACSDGGNPATFLAGRVGFAIATGRKKLKDTDGDGIYDDTDACDEVPGYASENPALNGCPLPDRDRDTILDNVDACPDVPGPANADPAKNGCPLPGDRDGDGIPDDQDACPTVPGAANPDPAKNGCPLDTDADGIFDPVDACPTVPGKPNADPAKNGCPDDADGDGILDAVDACPNDPGPANADPAKNGCPLVILTAGEIVIKEQVQFDTDKSTIKPVSNALLDSVAQVIKAHPEIKKIEIQGHTDSTGSKAHNQQLSAERASSVRKALESRGVESARFVSKGYGQDKPIGDNATDAGRTENRRVQFLILEKDKTPPKVIGTAVAPGATQVTPPAAPPPASPKP